MLVLDEPERTALRDLVAARRVCFDLGHAPGRVGASVYASIRNKTNFLVSAADMGMELNGIAEYALNRAWEPQLCTWAHLP